LIKQYQLAPIEILQMAIFITCLLSFCSYDNQFKYL